MRRCRLTPMQEAMLFEALDAPGRYVSVLRYWLDREPDIEALRTRLSLLTQRHEMLRSVIERGDDGGFWFRIEDRAEIALDAERFDEARPAIRPLSNPLLRLALCGNELAVVFSHIILDGWSVTLLMRELLAADPPSGAASPFRYYVKWLSGRDEAQDLAWWRGQLADMDPPMPLPNARRGAGGGRRSLRFFLPDSALLRRRAAEMKVTAGRLIQAVWCMLMARYQGGAAVTCTVVSGRSAPVPGIMGMAGMCVNTLPIPARLSGERRFSDWLAAFAKDAAEAERRGVCRLGDLVAGRVPHILAIDPPYDGEGFTLMSTSAELVSDFDAAFTLGDEIAAEFAYNDRAYREADVAAVQGHFLCALQAVLADPEIALRDVPLLTAAQIADMTAPNEDARALARIERETVVDLFLRSAVAHADRAALVSDEGTQSYAALAALVDQLARALRARGVGPEVCVGVALNRGGRYAACELAVLRAGGLFLPLDPHWPEARIALILGEVRPHLVIDEAVFTALMAEAADVELPMPDPSDAAYMIMTSGTTGVPKGVVVTHRSLMNFCLWAVDRYGWRAGDACAMVLGFGFDGSLWDILLPLISGGALHVPGDDVRYSISGLGAYCRAHGITHIDLPVTLAEGFLEAFGAENPIESLRHVVVGGEAVRRAVVSPYRVSNEYGPTECTVCCSAAWICEGDDPVPVGEPVPNMRALVLDALGNLCPDGVVGEAYFSGVQLARGYFGDPALTGERFVNGRFGALYRTGDLMRWSDQRGERALYFEGRADGQVKLNGFRVELGEVEMALRRDARVGAAVAVVRETAAGDKRLCAYVVDRGGLDLDALRRSLSAHLPAYMRPAIAAVDRIPLTASGKVDVAHLPMPDAAAGQELLAPETGAERALLDAVSQVLKADGIGMGHNFILSGGNSISAMRAQYRLEKAGYAVTAGAIVASATLRALAGLMVALRAEEQDVATDVFTPLDVQRSMLFLAQAAGSYTVMVARDAAGLTEAVLAGRLRRACALHDILRTRFECAEGGAVIGRVLDGPNAVVRRGSFQPAGGIDPMRDPLAEVWLSGGTLHLRYHHAALDGFGADMLMHELLTGVFPDRAPSFAAFANRLAAQADRRAADESWWDRYIDGAETVPLVSTERATARGGMRRIGVCDGALYLRCLDAARAARVTPAAFMMAAWGTALRALGGARGDVLIPFVASCRDDDGLMGMCAATMPLRFGGGEGAFSALARRVQSGLLDCAAHVFVPQRMVGELPRQLFVHEDGEGGQGMGEQDYALVAKFSGGCELLFDPALVADARAAQIATRLSAALAQAVEGRVSALMDGEYERVTQRFAIGRALGVAHADPADDLRAAMRAHPHNTAIGGMDYAALHRAAQALADELRLRGIGPGDAVAINMARTEGAVVAHVGICLSGAAFLPLDPDWPEARRREILEDSGASLVIGDGLTLTETGRRAHLPSDAAYILYTSGTTGKPKGAVLTKAALCNQIAWGLDEFGISVGDRVMHYVAFSFDPSVWTLFLALSGGAALLLAPDAIRMDPDQLAAYLDIGGATVAVFPAAVGVDVLNRAALGALRLAFLGGEAIRGLNADRPGLRVYNVYGPTEACINASFYRLKPGEADTRNIGVPVANMRCYVLDARGTPCPIGCPGELYLGGVQLATGYLNRPDETAAAFIDHPQFGRLYRTGDRAAWGEDGTLSFIARDDGQVKLRGYRVELGEIERALCDLDGVAEAKLRLSGGALDAYVVMADGEVGGLKEKLMERLPKYMLPNTITRLDKIPLNRHGKTDYSALPAPDAQPDDAFEAPETDAERLVADCWRRVLSLDENTPISRRAHFLALGGHSLQLFQVVGLMAARDRDVSIKQLIEDPTLAELALLIEGGAGDTAQIERRTTEGGDYEAYMAAERALDLSAVRRFSRIVITGGMGFLGSHLVREFFLETEAEIILPVRGGAARLADALSYYFGEAGAAMAGSDRLVAVEADLAMAQPDIDGPIDAVFHAAADVRHYAPDAAFHAANVTATEHMLAFAARHPGALFAHVSTTGSVNAPLIHETDTDMGPPFDNAYQRSKQLAEQRVFEAGVPYQIFRVGNLTPALSTGVPARTTAINSLLHLTRAMLRTGLRQEPDGQVGYVYVDETARAMRLLSAPLALVNHVFQLQNAHTIPFQRLFELAGVPCRALPKGELLRALRQMMASQDEVLRVAATEYYGRIAQIGLELRSTSDVIEGDLRMDATLETLERLGFRWPEISDAYARGYNGI